MKRILIAAGILLSFIACAPKNQAAPVNPAEYQSLNQDNMQQVRDFLHNTAVYFLKDAKATISAFTHDPIEIDF